MKIRITRKQIRQAINWILNSNAVDNTDKAFMKLVTICRKYREPEMSVEEHEQYIDFYGKYPHHTKKEWEDAVYNSTVKKYYVCGLKGIITAHRKLSCAEKAMNKRYKSIQKQGMESVMGIFKEEGGKYYRRVKSGTFEWNGEYIWIEVKSLCVEY